MLGNASAREAGWGADRVICALDCSAQRACELADGLLPAGLVWVKVGMELFYAAGPSFIASLKARGLKVFLDLKLHDIPNTVRNASRVVGSLGADMITVHAAGGPKMVQAAREGLEEAARETGGSRPMLLGVTVLTSMDRVQLESTGVRGDVAQQVRTLAGLACENGADGVVSSAWEAADLRGLLGADALIVTPGIRTSGDSVDDQSRVATPRFALEQGASHLVIGRPITRADVPESAFRAIVDSIDGQFVR